MNTIKQFSAVAAMLPLVCSAQIPISTTAQDVKFALTESTTIAGLAEKDSTGKVVKGAPATYYNEYNIAKGSTLTNVEEYGSKVQVSKISNKEILEALVEEEVISSIAGWSIVKAGNSMNSARMSSDGFYLTKKGAQPINISEYIQLYYAGADAVTANAKTTYVNSKEKVAIQEATNYASVEIGKSLVGVQLNFNGMNAQLQGVHSWGQSSLEKYTNPIPGAGSISALSGRVNYSDTTITRDLDSSASLLEGSISLGTGKPWNTNTAQPQ
jgi:hypothetical protein